MSTNQPAPGAEKVTEMTTMQLQTLKNTASAEDVAACIREHGYAIIEEMVPPAAMDRVAEELAPYVDASPFGESEETGRLTRRTGSLVARSPTARELIMNPTVLGAVRSLLSHASKIQLSLTEVISLWPGSPAQFIHQDELAFDSFPFPPDYEVQVSTLWAMTEYTEEMGATRIVPGSHKLGAGAKLTVADSIPAEMKRGSVMVYSGKVYHGSGENKSNRVRQAVNVDYIVGWLRQEENQYLSCPKEIASTLPEDLLRLMGYDCCYALGHMGDRFDPLGAVLEKYRNVRAIPG